MRLTTLTLWRWPKWCAAVRRGFCANNASLEQYPPEQPPRRYVSGETHRYLGRQYRLKVHELTAAEPAIERVKLSGGFLSVWTVNPYDTEHVQMLVDSWVRRQAERVFAERLDGLLPRFQPLPSSAPH